MQAYWIVSGRVNSKFFSPRFISIIVAGLALSFTSLACGGAAATEAFPAPAAGATQPPGATEAAEPLFLLVTSTASPLMTAVAEAPTSKPSPQPAINESRRLTLEFPPQIRVGEGDVVRLTLEVDTLGNLTPTAELENTKVTGEVVQIPNLYETHNVTAEARFDIAGMDVKPADVISEPVTPGQSVTFYWSIRPQEVGVYRGTIWLYLRFVDKSNGKESRKTVSAQLVEIKAVNLLDLPLGLVRGAGALGSFVGGIIGFPFLEDIIKLLFRRIKK